MNTTFELHCHACGKMLVRVDEKRHAQLTGVPIMATFWECPDWEIGHDSMSEKTAQELYQRLTEPK